MAELSCEIAVRWLSLDLTDKPTLAQVVALYYQVTSYYLSQCGPSSMPGYGIARPQSVKQFKQLCTCAKVPGAF